jgi:hypothetical protein
MHSTSSTFGYSIAARFVAFILFIGVAIASMPAHSSELDDYIAKATQKCNEEVQRLEELKQASAAKSPPTSGEDIAVMNRLEALAERTRELISQGPPTTPAEKQEYAQKLAAAAGEGGMIIHSVENRLGIAPKSPGVVLRALKIDADDFKERISKGFDGARGSGNPDINIGRSADTPFFSGRPSLPQSTVRAEVKTTSEADARRITDRDGHWGGGVMLEGAADRLGPISRVRYNIELNALVLDNRAIYRLKIMPWTAAVLCRAIAADENERIGVSLTGQQSLFFGKEEIYRDSGLARDLKLADRFLADIVFAYNKWTAGYNHPDGFQPEASQEDTHLAVRFAFTGFKFQYEQDEIRATQAELEVRFAPLMAGEASGGGLVPDYEALRQGFQPPPEYTANAQFVSNNIEHYRQERLVRRMFDYGEVAAFLRGLKKSNVNLSAVARDITTVN